MARFASKLAPLFVLSMLALAAPKSTTASSTAREWSDIKEGLRANKQSMCSFLLGEIRGQNETLTLEKVTHLFEQALDHLGRANEYITKIRPYIEREALENFDRSGAGFVLEVSGNRVALIEQYRKASGSGASEGQLAAILEKYFYKACASKLGMVLTEKSMYDSALKVEKLMRADVGLHQEVEASAGGQ